MGTGMSETTQHRRMVLECGQQRNLCYAPLCALSTSPGISYMLDAGQEQITG